MESHAQRPSKELVEGARVQALVEVYKGEEVIFSKRTDSPTLVAEINRLYANHATCVVTVTYL